MYKHSIKRQRHRNGDEWMSGRWKKTLNDNTKGEIQPRGDGGGDTAGLLQMDGRSPVQVH